MYLAKVATLEYDPNRTANIALLHYVDGEKDISYSKRSKKGDTVLVRRRRNQTRKCISKLKDLPVVTTIHNVELLPGKRGQLARSHWTSARLVAKEGVYRHVELPSGELRLIHKECTATVGSVGNSEHSLVSLGKAGRNRHKGRRPHVRDQ